MFLLAPNAAMGDWTETNSGPLMRDQVTAQDVRRVANTYFGTNQRNVMIINTKASPAGESRPGMSPRTAQMVQRIQSMTDPAELEQMIAMVSMRLEGIEDPERKGQMEKMLEIAAEHLKKLKTAGSK
jgi:hypothetical protein